MAKMTKSQLRRRKAMNVSRGLIEQGYEMNWPRASATAKSERLERGLRKPKRRTTNGIK